MTHYLKKKIIKKPKIQKIFKLFRKRKEKTKQILKEKRRKKNRLFFAVNLILSFAF